VLAFLFFGYLGMMSLVSATARFFVPVAPLGLALAVLAFSPRIERYLAGGKR
jgi:hypothetical protein